MVQTYQGMLDEFAGRAMQALITTGLELHVSFSVVAQESYNYSLAMMKERDRIKAEMDPVGKR